MDGNSPNSSLVHRQPCLGLSIPDEFKCCVFFSSGATSTAQAAQPCIAVLRQGRWPSPTDQTILAR